MLTNTQLKIFLLAVAVNWYFSYQIVSYAYSSYIITIGEVLDPIGNFVLELALITLTGFSLLIVIIANRQRFISAIEEIENNERIT